MPAMASSTTGPKYEPRTNAQREADAQRNEPKYARERRVSSAMTAKYLKAKSAFDGYYGYDIDAAFNADDGSWNEEKDPWLRIQETLFEFLRGYTKASVDAGDSHLTGEGLRHLAAAIIRVAKEDLAGANRDNAFLDDAFQRSAFEYVETLKAMHSLPDAAPPAKPTEPGDEEQEEDDTNK